MRERLVRIVNQRGDILRELIRSRKLIAAKQQQTKPSLFGYYIDPLRQVAINTSTEKM